MDFKKYLFLAAAITFCLAAAYSCKDKEDEDVVYKYLSGSISFEMPEFAAVGDEFTIAPEDDLSREEGDTDGGIGICWKLSPMMVYSDTLRLDTDPVSKAVSFIVQIPDSLTTLTTTVTGYASGYISTSTSKTTTVIRLTGSNPSLTGVSFPDDCEIFTDPRDGNIYHCIVAGGKVWFGENLAYKEKGMSYQGCDVVSPLFGCYYTWEDAKDACPEGWALPSRADFAAVAQEHSQGVKFGDNDVFTGVAGAFMTDARFNYEKMWEFWPEVKITNKTGLSVLPCGYAAYRVTDQFAFSGFKDYATLWTSDSMDEEQAYYRYIISNKPDMFIGTAHKDSFAASIRCVKDIEEE